MTNTQFIGEHLWPGQLGHLWPGQLGHFFVIVSFVSALFSTFSYMRAVKTEGLADEKSWRNLGRIGFGLHTGSVIAIFIALFYIITNHLFEYHYAWEHSSYDMPSEYLLLGRTAG